MEEIEDLGFSSSQRHREETKTPAQPNMFNQQMQGMGGMPNMNNMSEMMNNPMVKEMMNNPEMMKMAQQMMMG